MKPHAPLPGYNNNIAHAGRLFHVQTEDAGAQRAYLVTHLFADGGRVVSSAKRSYKDIAGSETFAEQVRALMREQHKGMVVALRSGELDAALGGECEADEADRAPASSRARRRAEDAAPVSPRRTGGRGPHGELTPPQGTRLGIDELERAAAEAEKEFLQEIQSLSADAPDSTLRGKPGDLVERPGSYRFVETGYRPKKSVPPPASKAKPRRADRTAMARSEDTRPDVARPDENDFDGRKTNPLNPQPGRTRKNTQPLDTASLGRRKGEAEGDGAGPRPFGAELTSSRSFDEVVLAFLSARSRGQTGRSDG